MAAAAGLPASSAAGMQSAMPMRRDADDLAFPVAGSALLAVLLLVAAWARYAGPRAGERGTALPRAWRRIMSRNAPAHVGGPRVGSPSRLDAHTCLHTVEWEGRRMLVACTAGTPPVVLDRLVQAMDVDGRSAS